MKTENNVALPSPMLSCAGRCRRWYLFPLLLLPLFLAACGPSTPTPFPAATDAPVVTLTPTITPTPIPLTRYRNDSGIFAVDLPVTWAVEQRGLTPLGEYYQFGPAPVGPGPHSSALFLAPREQITPAAAAEALLCGSGCAEAITLEETTVAGRPAARALLSAGEATLEWFFVEHQEHLIFFTIHDPETLATRTDLLDSFAFLEPAPTPTATTVPATPAPAATATSPAARWETWQTVSVENAGVSFEIPDGWVTVQEGPSREWAPVADSEVRFGLSWRSLAPDQALRLLLPPAEEITDTVPLTMTWEGELSDAFYRGEQVTLRNEAGWEEHALFQVGLRAYDVYVRGPAEGSLATLQPVLAQALASLEVTEPRLALEDPLEAAVIWFGALLEERSGNVARAYMTPALRAQVPQDTSPMTLLALEQGLAIYNLTWLSGGQQEAVVEAEITLPDESVVRRHIILLRDPVAGWQVNAVVIPEGP